MPEIAIIGGSGVYQIEGVKVVSEHKIKTPFGMPSDTITVAEIGGKQVAFLPRHGKGHRYLPGEIPVRANAWAFKKLGVRKVIGISAVGSLVEKIAPKDFAIPSQLIDRTKDRPLSLFGNGIVGHVSFADPFCPCLTKYLYETISQSKTVNVHKDVTYVCMEGPQFSTKAESNLHRAWGAHLIGMTAVPEAKIMREAELCYAMIALSTDYDCWHEEIVTVEMVIENMKSNVANVKKLLPQIIAGLDLSVCSCESAAKYAIMTDLKLIPKKTRKELEIFYGKYFQ